MNRFMLTSNRKIWRALSQIHPTRASPEEFCRTFPQFRAIVRIVCLSVAVMLSLPVLTGPLTADLCGSGPCCNMPPAMAADCCTIEEAPPEQPESVLTTLPSPQRASGIALHDAATATTVASDESVRNRGGVRILAPPGRERLALLSTYLI
jgi:hypothetical protein